MKIKSKGVNVMKPDEIGKKIIDKIEKNNKEENEEVTIVVGLINATNTVLYWKYELEAEIIIGDYAIVENKDGYDLIKIIGILKTNKKYVTKFSFTKYENMKSTIGTLSKKYLDK